MERPNAWKTYTEEESSELEKLAHDYIDFISDNKIEREFAAASIKLAEEAGYKPLAEAIKEGRQLKPGDKVWADVHGKAVILAYVGEKPMTEGFNILGAHIDSPRLDIKQNPLYEANDFALLDTHYYGGIKKYQWTALPLAIHGVIAKKDGTVVPVALGENPNDPVFCVTDLLIHLANKQMAKKGNEVVEGEALDVLFGGKPLVIDEADAEEAPEDAPAWEKLAGKEPVKAYALKALAEKYDIEEEDFLSAELEVVPAGRARDLGFDRSMVLAYGQDDKVCAYTSLVAQLALDEIPEKTALTVLVDKEEIGSVGATGMASLFFENTVADLMALSGQGSDVERRHALAASKMLSSDVSAGFDPTYASVFDKNNCAYLGRGLVINKYTGSRGKSGSNDARAEYVADVRRIMDDAGVAFQTAELGKVDAGGGGTIAYLPAKYGMDVIDSGVAVLSMHAPWEATSKADIYEAKKGYEAFLKNA